MSNAQTESDITYRKSHPELKRHWFFRLGLTFCRTTLNEERRPYDPETVNYKFLECMDVENPLFQISPVRITNTPIIQSKS